MEMLYAKAVLTGSKAQDDGSKLYTFKITSEVIDRQNEVVTEDGWEFGNFHKNPVILDSHNYWAISAIVGRGVGGVRQATGGGYELDILFAPTEEGQKAQALVDGGFLNAVSVGFRSSERAFGADRSEPMKHTRKELLEVSVVSVPANAEALRQRGALPALDADAIAAGLVAMLAKRGIKTDDLTTQTPPPAAEGEGEVPGINEGESVADYAKRLLALKAGAALNRKNKGNLEQAMGLIQEVLDSAKPAEGDQEGAKTGAPDASEAGDQDSNPNPEGEGADAATDDGGDEGGDAQNGDAGAFDPEAIKALQAFVAAK